MQRFCNLYFILLTVCLAQAVQPVSVLAEDPIIHVQWDLGGSPEPDQDYEITPGEFPEIELITAHTDWRVWSTDPDNPASIGDIGRIWTDSVGNFGVKVLTPSNTPGARNVDDISLQPPGEDDWSGVYGSGQNPSRVTGNVGDVSVRYSRDVQDSGVVAMIIEGTLTGEIVTTGEVYIDVNAVASTGRIEFGFLTELGNFRGKVYVANDLAGVITIPEDQQTMIGDTYVQVDGDVTSTGVISIKALQYDEHYQLQPQI